MTRGESIRPGEGLLRGPTVPADGPSAPVLAAKPRLRLCANMHVDCDCRDTCLIEQAVAGLSVGLLLLNAAGRVLWLNRAAEAVLGLASGEAQGRPVEHVLRDPQLAAFWNDTAGKAGNCLGEVAVRWPRAMDLKINATQCYDTHGRTIGRALLFCDVTEDRTVQINLSQAVASRLLDLTHEHIAAEPVAGLTPQEMRILRLVGRGMGNEDIATEAGISSSTVRSHLKSVYRKLGFASRSEAVSYAVRNHLV